MVDIISVTSWVLQVIGACVNALSQDYGYMFELYIENLRAQLITAVVIR